MKMELFSIMAQFRQKKLQSFEHRRCGMLIEKYKEKRGMSSIGAKHSKLDKTSYEF